MLGPEFWFCGGSAMVARANTKLNSIGIIFRSAFLPAMVMYPGVQIELMLHRNVMAIEAILQVLVNRGDGGPSPRL